MQYDALVIGGSFAGLSAAMHIARARRSVCVVDAGAPRNRFANASHGFFGQDGNEPLSMIAGARARGRSLNCIRPSAPWKAQRPAHRPSPAASRYPWLAARR